MQTRRIKLSIGCGALKTYNMHGSLSQFKAALARKAEREQKRNARSDRNGGNYGTEKRIEKDEFPQFSKLEV